MRPVFVQIKCEIGKAGEVAEALYEHIEEISELYSTSGSYDLLAKFYIEESGSIPDFINGTLHKVPGIRDTDTIIAFRIGGKADTPHAGLSRPAKK